MMSPWERESHKNQRHETQTLADAKAIFRFLPIKRRESESAYGGMIAFTSKLCGSTSMVGVYFVEGGENVGPELVLDAAELGEGEGEALGDEVTQQGRHPVLRPHQQQLQQLRITGSQR